MSATLGNGNITFGDGTTQSTLASMLGMGQSWQDVTSSRACATTYTNSTGKPIFVNIGWEANQTNAYATLYIGGIVACYSFMDTYARLHLRGIVPNGSTYSVTSTQTNLTNSHWCELR